MSATRPLSLMDVYRKYCPDYMSYGMTYDQYWDGDVWAHRQYAQAHKKKIQEDNALAWLQGRYFYDALCAASPIIRAFSKARKPGKYHEHPIDLFEEDQKKRQEDEQRKRYEKMREKVALFAEEFNKKRKEFDENAEGKGVSENAG